MVTMDSLEVYVGRGASRVRDLFKQVAAMCSALEGRYGQSALFGTFIIIFSVFCILH